jgi:carbamate kinase
MLIRPMLPDDADAVRAADLRAFGPYFQLKRIEHMPMRTHRNVAGCLALYPAGCFVAEEDGIAGYVFSRVWGAIGWIGVFGVTADRPGQGIGGQLLAAAIESLRGSGCTTIGLETMPDSPSNVGLYAGRGFRRVVASPRPKKIIELEAIRTLLDANCVVVAVGGGGIPVVEQDNGELVGADAVIDKDLATSLLARQLHADMLIISTAVDQVFVNFKKPDQKAVPRMTVAEAKKYLAEGQFAPGSMKPKVEAVIEFLEGGGKEALITDPPHLVAALAGKSGTWIVP